MATGAGVFRRTVAAIAAIRRSGSQKTGERYHLNNVGRRAGRAFDARGFPVERRQLVKPRVALSAVEIVYRHLFGELMNLRIYELTTAIR